MSATVLIIDDDRELCALLADFLFLPPLLMKLQEKRDEKARLAAEPQPARS